MNEFSNCAVLKSLHSNFLVVAITHCGILGYSICDLIRLLYSLLLVVAWSFKNLFSFVLRPLAIAIRLLMCLPNPVLLSWNPSLEASLVLASRPVLQWVPQWSILKPSSAHSIHSLPAQQPIIIQNGLISWTRLTLATYINLPDPASARNPPRVRNAN